MWPTFYIPPYIKQPAVDRDCWDYLIGSGTTERVEATGVIADPDITFTAKAGYSYRVLGRISWVVGETSPKRGGTLLAAWQSTAALAAFMSRSHVSGNMTTSDVTLSTLTTEPWVSFLSNLDASQGIDSYPSGGVIAYYSHAFVDLFLVGGAVDSTVSLKWGVATGSSSTSAWRLLNKTFLTVREYLP